MTIAAPLRQDARTGSAAGPRPPWPFFASCACAAAIAEASTQGSLRRRRAVIALVLLLVVPGACVTLLANLHRLRGPIERTAARSLQRGVTIGDLRLRWNGHPVLELHDVVIGLQERIAARKGCAVRRIANPWDCVPLEAECIEPEFTRHIRPPLA